MHFADFSTFTNTTRTPRGFAFPSMGRILTTLRTRKQLAGLSQAQLMDVGISPEDRDAELDRPFWDVPNTL